MITLKRILILFCICQCGSLGYSQVEGTLLIAVKCQEGMLVFADTRGTCGDVFYVDSIQKVFRHGRNLIAIEGNPLIRDTFLYSHISAIDTHITSPFILLSKIVDHFKQSLKPSEFDSLAKNTKILTAGFHNDTTRIFWTDTNWVQCKFSYSACSIGPYLNYKYLKTLTQYSYKEVIPKVLGIYNMVASHFLTVSPDPVIWLIDNEAKSPRCISNCDQHELKTLLGFYSEIIFDQNKAIPIGKNTDLDIITYINDILRKMKLN